MAIVYAIPDAKRENRMHTSELPGHKPDGELSFPERVQVLINRAGSIEDLARKAGLSPRVVRKYRDGESDPSRERTIALARAVGVTVEWLATGEGQMIPEERKEGVPAEGYIALPRYDVRAAAGDGALMEQTQERVVDWIYFKQEWLRNTLGLGPQRLAVIEAVGDSMAPSINDGDLLLVDVGEPPLRGDGIYVIAVDDALLVKRIAIKLGGGLVISSDNPQYHATSQEVDREELDDVRVVGRVVWVGGRI